MTLDEFQEALEGAGHRWNIRSPEHGARRIMALPHLFAGERSGVETYRSRWQSPRSNGNAWWDDAAKYLGLKISDARRIVDAADNLDGPDTPARAWLRRLVDTP